LPIRRLLPLREDIAVLLAGDQAQDPAAAVLLKFNRS